MDSEYLINRSDYRIEELRSDPPEKYCRTNDTNDEKGQTDEDIKRKWYYGSKGGVERPDE